MTQFSPNNQINQVRSEYQIHLNASIDCVRFLLRQGVAFCGHDESEDSSDQGNFLEHLRFLVDHNKDIKVVTLKNALDNIKLTILEIHKDIVRVAVIETINAIIRDLGNALFSISIDESRDLSRNEQMAIVFSYVDKKKCM